MIILFTALARLKLIHQEIDVLFVTQNRFPNLGVISKPEEIVTFSVPAEGENTEEQHIQCFTSYSVENCISNSNGKYLKTHFQ